MPYDLVSELSVKLKLGAVVSLNKTWVLLPPLILVPLEPYAVLNCALGV